ncbi:hypothetical protein AMJ52_05370 [candidate division TA06 bacterium DG_78]|uniref:Uncharacterized protein n=1 Tax=candidate division TA06 bacterium DG_78 TaxID=1703772 RepID=A0A0S7YD84_UNCT6|nr:MAG: hypothetical protein AMJ52_05370 [candidate division TA06 bacterium DG_78]
MRGKQFLFNESDIRLHYKLLRHTYVSELRLLKRGLYPVCRIVRDEESFVSVCRQWNGRRNIYVGLRDRKQGLRSCARSEDIIGCQAVILDIDPDRASETPATEQELESAIKAAQKASTWFTKYGFTQPHIAITGNGCCLYFFLPYIKLKDNNRLKITRKIELFEHWVRQNIKEITEHYKCTIDRMYDLPRIVRVVGTCNIKGNVSKYRPHRISCWLKKPELMVEDKKLLKFILGCKDT